jgi:uncharacterized protein YjcR
MRRDIPWQEARSAFRAGATLADLGRRYGVDPTTVAYHCRREGWAADLPEAPAVLPRRDLIARLEGLAASLLSAAERGEVGSVKDVKDLAALAKDLAALRRGQTADAPAVIRVELSPEVEPWAE